MTTTSADSARADTRSVRKASEAIAIGAGQSTETITCKRCGQEMESADEADGCEDFQCSMKN